MQMWDETGTRDAEAFALLDAALDWFDEAHLRAIVDLHILRTHYFHDPETPRLWTDPAETDRLVGLWLDLSEHLRDRPVAGVAYELLNEPVAPDDEDWNRVYAPVFAALRRAEPERILVLGGNMWSSPEHFENLQVPDDDRCILAFHFYLPTLVTHYRSHRRFGFYEGPVQYPGRPIPAEVFAKLAVDAQELLGLRNEPFGPEQMRQAIQAPLDVRERSRLPLYCGEFGCAYRCPEAVRAAWHRDFVRVLESEGIAWAHWNFLGGFSVLGPDGQETIVSDALLGRRRPES